MITISLDETNGFEEWCASDKAVFVGGVIYDDGDNETDTKIERHRIFNYYTNVVKDTLGDTTLFPSALHYGNGTNESVKAVKETVKNTLGEFIIRGTYKGEMLHKVPRKGKYYLFIYMKSDTGVSDLLRETKNVLSKDNYASNLYFHMTTEIVDRLVFHNPIIKSVKEVAFNLPTRESRDFDKESETGYIEEYSRQAMVGKKNKGESVHFSIAGSEMYRTALAQKMLMSDKTSVTIRQFSVRSIDYKNSFNMEFLYLADSLCSVVKENLKGKNEYAWIKDIDQSMDTLNDPSCNMVFAYDDIDVKYAKAWEQYEKGNLYAAIETIHNAEKDKGIFAGYYKKRWFGNLRNIIVTTKHIEYLADAINELGRSLFSNKYSQDCGLDIFRTLEKIADNNEKIIVETERQRLLCDLYSHGISVYCHMGDSKKAHKYFNKFKQYKDFLKPDEYISALKRLVEVELDQFQWDKAEKNAKECVDIQELLADYEKEMDIFGDKNELCSLELGKAYSLMGRVFAFKRDVQAEKFFLSAMDNFKKNSPDYKITQSYLLHHYIDIGAEGKYEDEATNYFGGETSISKRFGYIIKNAFCEYPVINYKYALHVFIKGLYCFEMEKLSDDMYLKLISINEQIKKADIKARNRKSTFVELINHPAEIIYKYIALIAWDRGDKNKAKEYISKVVAHSEDDGAIIRLIRYDGVREFYNHIVDKEREKKTVSDMKEYINLSAPDWLKGNDPTDDAIMSIIENRLTYMYR